MSGLPKRLSAQKAVTDIAKWLENEDTDPCESSSDGDASAELSSDEEDEVEEASVSSSSASSSDELSCEAHERTTSKNETK
jgi:hypothetical protein